MIHSRTSAEQGKKGMYTCIYIGGRRREIATPRKFLFGFGLTYRSMFGLALVFCLERAGVCAQSVTCRDLYRPVAKN